MKLKSLFPSLFSAQMFFMPDNPDKVVGICRTVLEKENCCRILKANKVAKKIICENSAIQSDVNCHAFLGLKGQYKIKIESLNDRSFLLISKNEKTHPIETILTDLGLQIDKGMPEKTNDAFNRLFKENASKAITYLLSGNFPNLFALRQLYLTYKHGCIDVEKNFTQARTYLGLMFDIEPNDRAIFEELVKMCLPGKFTEEPDFPKVKRLLKRALEKDPDDYFALDPLFTIYTREIKGVKTNVPKAIKYVEAALERNPTSQFGLWKILDIYVNKMLGIPGDHKKALHYFYKALEKDRNNRQVLEWTVTIHFTNNEVLEEIEVLEMTIKANPAHEWALERLVFLYRYGRKGIGIDTLKAINCLETAVEFNPDLTYPLEELVKIFFDGSIKGIEKDVPRAMRYLEKALDKGSSGHYASWTAVWLYFAIGESDKAVACLEKNLQKDPGDRLSIMILEDIRSNTVDAIAKDLPTMIRYLEKASKLFGQLVWTVDHLKKMNQES